ncbi:hypothetical protein [Streptomyces sp. NPDC002994]|uniref:lipase family alpha/beta hydrolase n=1 Tax=Streptomyces sp. NPDC002994 TaxID=3154441 RepID=UPI0033BF4CBC
MFVHGWHSGGTTWDSMREEARLAGYDPERELRVFDYSRMSNTSESAPIETIAEELDRFITGHRLVEDSPDGTVDIVAHSMGSLVARHYLKFGDGALDKVSNYVSLAGPNHGTLLADQGREVAGTRRILDVAQEIIGRRIFPRCDLQCTQMSRHSEFLTRLNEGPETPRSQARPGWPRYTTFRSNVGDEPVIYANSRNKGLPKLGLCDETVFGVSRNGRLVLNPQDPRQGLADTTALHGAKNLTTGCLSHGAIPDDQWTQDEVLDTLAAPTGEYRDVRPPGRPATPVRGYTECNDLEKTRSAGGNPHGMAWVQTCLRVHSNYRSVTPVVRVRGCGHVGPSWDNPQALFYAPEAYGDNIPCTVNGAYSVRHPNGFISPATLSGTLQSRAGEVQGEFSEDGGHGGYYLSWREPISVNQSNPPMVAYDGRDAVVYANCSPVAVDLGCKPAHPNRA